MSRRYMFRPKFHLSPEDQAFNIKRYGLLADKSRAGNCRIWMCDWDAIPHIGQHLLQDRKRKIVRFAVFSIRYWNLEHSIRKHASGIYYYIGNIPAVHIDHEYSFWCERGVDVALVAKGVCP